MGGGGTVLSLARRDHGPGGWTFSGRRGGKRNMGLNAPVVQITTSLQGSLTLKG